MEQREVLTVHALSVLSCLISTLKMCLPFKSKIKFVILLTVNHKILIMLLQRFSIGSINYPQIDSFLYSHHLSG